METTAGTVVIEFVDSAGKVAARVSLPEPAMFWSDGRFERGEAFDVHRDIFRHVEEASRRFQAADPGDGELEELERAWRELNERFEIRQRGESRSLEDVGLHLDGERASVRY
jgi:hypothetical protein